MIKNKNLICELSSREDMAEERFINLENKCVSIKWNPAEKR